MPTLRGFILQPTYRVLSGVPVLHLFGRLEDGRSFLVRDRRLVPRFYVERDDAARARERGARKQFATDQVTLLGRPVARIEVKEPADTPPLRDRLTRAGIPTYEADVRFALRHLIDRGIRGSLEIHGEGREVPGLGLVFEDPISSQPTGRRGSPSSLSTSRPIPRPAACSRSASMAVAHRRCSC